MAREAFTGMSQTDTTLTPLGGTELSTDTGGVLLPAGPLAAPLPGPRVKEGLSAAALIEAPHYGVLSPAAEESLRQQLVEFASRDEEVAAQVDAFRDNRLEGSAELPLPKATAKPDHVPTALAAPGQDVFSDIIVAQRAKQELPEQQGVRNLWKENAVVPEPQRQRHEQPKAAKAPETPSEQRAAEQQQQEQQQQGQPPEPGMAERYTGRAIHADRNGKLYVSSLAGQGTDWFNVAMKRGDECLKSGDYYRAEGQFELAGSIEPRNPLSHLGRGISLFAAGEPLAAATSVGHAIEVYPPLMEVQVDLGSLVDQNVLNKRLEALKLRLGEAKTPSADLLFIAAYVYHNLGQDDQARDLAKQLSAVVGDPQAYSDFASYLLNGSRPSHAAETR